MSSLGLLLLATLTLASAACQEAAPSPEKRTSSQEPTTEELEQIQVAIHTTDLALALQVRAVGGAVDATFTVRNEGPNPANGPAVRFRIPPGATVAGVRDARCKADGEVQQCVLDSILAGSSASFVLTLAAEATGPAFTIVLDASATNLLGPDPNPSNDRATSTALVGP